MAVSEGTRKELGGRFALMGRKYAFLGRRARADRFGNMLFNSVLQPFLSGLWIHRPTDCRRGMRIELC